MSMDFATRPKLPELETHYFRANLPAQFDEHIWFNETCAIEPIGVPPEHPFALGEASAR